MSERKSQRVSEFHSRDLPEPDEVTSSPDRVIYIQHRNRPGRVALTSESYLRYLETTVQTLRTVQSGLPFQLFDSGTLHVPAGEVLEKVRQRQGELAAAKRNAL